MDKSKNKEKRNSPKDNFPEVNNISKGITNIIYNLVALVTKISSPITLTILGIVILISKVSTKNVNRIVITIRKFKFI